MVFIFQTFVSYVCRGLKFCLRKAVKRSSFKSVLNHRKAYIFQAFAEGLLSICVCWISQSIHLSNVCWSKTPWVKFYFGLSLHIFLCKIRETPGACIKPGCLARHSLCHKVYLPSCVWSSSQLCHKVNLLSCVARRPLRQKVNRPRCEARWRPFIVTCDIFGTGQTNILALRYLFGKNVTSPQ